MLRIGPDRTAKTLLRFFRFLGKERCAQLQFVCSDMWQAYIKVIAKKVPHAIHILDRLQSGTNHTDKVLEELQFPNLQHAQTADALETTDDQNFGRWYI